MNTPNAWKNTVLLMLSFVWYIRGNTVLDEARDLGA